MEDTHSPAITLQGFSFQYAGAKEQALREMDIKVERGEMVLLCGSTGSGKSTLLRCLKRELTPHGQRSGTILFGGREQCKLEPLEAAGRIGFVLQDPDNGIVTDTVWHELAFGLENLGLPTAVIRRRVAETAHFFGIAPWYRRRVHELSGGQKQILNLASIMAMQPEILLLDEPTAQLDPIAAGEFLQALGRIHRELGVTVILCEHRMEEILPMVDSVLYLEAGRAAFRGTPRGFAEFVLAAPSHPFIPALPAACRLPGGRPLITVAQGRDWIGENACKLACRKSVTDPVPGEPVLSAKELWFQYDKGQPYVLRGVELALHRGEILALVGGNGSGKSTALSVLCGLQRPARGRIKRAKGSRVALLVQRPRALFTCDTLREDLMACATDEKAMLAQAGYFGLTRLLAHHPYDLSGGEMQKAALCKLLLTEPDILLLDEPTKGLDAFAKAEIAALLRRLAGAGKAILLVTHDLEFAAANAHRCAMLFDGEVLCTQAAHAFFLGNMFYTTAVSRMTRGLVEGCVVEEDILWNGR